MAGRKKKDTTADDDASPREKGRSRKERARDTVASVSDALRNRDQIVANALDLLLSTGFIDAAMRDRVWELYEKGDARTRLAVQELIARTLGVPLEHVEEKLQEGVDEEDLQVKHLEKLARLSLPKVDVKKVTQRVRDMDLDELLDDTGVVARAGLFVANLPLHALRLRRRLILGGLVFSLLAIAGAVFPAHGRLVAYYVGLFLLLLVGVFLLKWAHDITRAAKRLGIDLGVYGRLSPEERRLLLLRRLWLRFVDTDRLADWIVRGVERVVPDSWQGEPDQEPPARTGSKKNGRGKRKA